MKQARLSLRKARLSLRKARLSLRKARLSLRKARLSLRKGCKSLQSWWLWLRYWSLHKVWLWQRDWSLQKVWLWLSKGAPVIFVAWCVGVVIFLVLLWHFEWAIGYSTVEHLRNMALLLLGVPAFLMAAWRGWQTNMQLERADRQHFQSNLHKALDMLTDDNPARVITGARILADLWPQTEQYRDVQTPILAALRSVLESSDAVKSDYQADDDDRKQELDYTINLSVRSALADLIITIGSEQETIPVELLLPSAHLENVDLERACLDGANLAHARLDGANLRHARLNGANLTSARLDGANLTDAHLNEANLTCARLDGADLAIARLNGTDLRHARLDGAKLIHAGLEQANLMRAHLEQQANLMGARLNEANLEHARLNGANLADARLDGANLVHACLDGANLSAANFKNAKGLTKEQLLSAGWLRVEDNPGGFGPRDRFNGPPINLPDGLDVDDMLRIVRLIDGDDDDDIMAVDQQQYQELKAGGKIAIKE